MPRTPCPSIADGPLRPVIHSGSFIGAEVPVWDIADSFGEHQPAGDRHGAGAGPGALPRPNNVALMRGHGFAAAGRSLIEVVRMSVYVPRNARVQMSALRLGGEIKPLPDGEIAARDAGYKPRIRLETWRAWEYWAHKSGCAHLLDPTGGVIRLDLNRLLPGGFGNVARAFAHRNYRVYVGGNGVSLIGWWLQRVAVGWLAWTLTHSGTWLGLVSLADFLPVRVPEPVRRRARRPARPGRHHPDDARSCGCAQASLLGDARLRPARSRSSCCSRWCCCSGSPTRSRNPRASP